MLLSSDSHLCEDGPRGGGLFVPPADVSVGGLILLLPPSGHEKPSSISVPREKGKRVFSLDKAGGVSYSSLLH